MNEVIRATVHFLHGPRTLFITLHSLSFNIGRQGYACNTKDLTKKLAYRTNISFNTCTLTQDPEDGDLGLGNNGQDLSGRQ